MKKIETLWKVLYKIFIIFGTPFLLIGIFFLLVDGNWAFILNGILWIVPGIIVKIKCDFYENMLQNFKTTGICCDATVVDISYYPLIRIGSYLTARIQCSCIDTENKPLTKHGYYVLLPFDKKENLCPKIYFNNSNPDDCILELYRINT